MKKKMLTNTKVFSVKELKRLEVPSFQRWIVEKNKSELSDSIEQIGLLRCPVVCYVKSEEKNYIIDGNHIREILIDNYNPTDDVMCIYSEVNTYSDAAEVFKMLNIKGKKLDWVDITNLYMHTSVFDNNIYKQVWNLIGNPSTQKDVKQIPGFSISTIIEVLCGDKNKYKEGEVNTDLIQNYVLRKNLLTYLIQEAPREWTTIFTTNNLRKPTGGAIIAFMKLWFNKGYHKKYTEEEFLTFTNGVYLELQDELKHGGLIINRDNGGVLFETHIQKLNESSLELIK